MNRSITLLIVLAIGIVIGLLFHQFALLSYDWSGFVNNQASNPVLQSAAQTFVETIKQTMYVVFTVIVLLLPIIGASVYYLWNCNSPGRKNALGKWFKWFAFTMLIQLIATIGCLWWSKEANDGNGLDGILAILGQFAMYGFLAGIVLYLFASFVFACGKNTYCTAPITWFKKY